MKLIQLTKGQFAQVDDDDFEELNKYKWSACLCINGYRAVRNIPIHGRQKTLLLHRAITNAQDGQIVDHRDGNHLNNQRSNLRFCTLSQNQHNRKINSNNSTGYKGIYPSKKGYRAQIYLNGKQIYLGTRSTPEEAHHLYIEASTKYHGDFGRVE